MPHWTATDLPDLTGRTVVITGATGGIGLVTARELQRVGAHVVLAVRNVQKGLDAGFADVRHLDVSSLASVRRFAADWTGDIDILINNAGVMDVPLARTAEGLDLQTATNYFGPALLTNLLLPVITDRVVHVSSELHRQAKLKRDDLNWETRTYKGLQAYHDSKLAVALYSLELQRRLAASGSAVRSIVAHPGVAPTNLVSHSSANAVMRLRFLLNTVEKGALPTLFAATQDVAGGSYVGPDGFLHFQGWPVVHLPSRAARDEAAARQLWDVTERLIA
jgi:NAD(P)-dependent dehydrogenase (short-subunit alcohol dehydrogenase family)